MTKLYKLMSIGALSTAALYIAFAGNAFAATTQTTPSMGKNRPLMTVEQRTAHETEMKTKLTESMTKAITDKRLTEEQKNYILEVMNQVHVKMNENNITEANALKSELKTWAADQQIDETLIPGQRNGMGRGGLYRGSGQGHGFGNHNNS